MRANKLLASVFVLLAGSARVLGDGYSPPDISENVSMPWKAGIYAAIALGGIMFVAFKNSKRTHLD